MITPAGVIRPIVFPAFSVNHRLPSGPVVIEVGPLFDAERGYSASAVVVADAPRTVSASMITRAASAHGT